MIVNTRQENSLKDKRNRYIIVGFVLLVCFSMYVIEVYVSPAYWLKSILKLVCFGGCILLYRAGGNDDCFSALRLPSWKKLLPGFALGLLVYVAILAGYFLLRTVIDLDAIAINLQQQGNITKHNFVLVALYICLVNSGLEELFFRGFAFLQLKKCAPRWLAYWFSGLAFALYHVAIMSSWFTPWLFLLLVAGLAGAGMLFDWLDEKSGSIYPAWLLHFFANLSINTIGFMMFGMI